MIRKRIVCAVICGAALAIPAAAAGQACPGGAPVRGDVGIRAVRCTGPSAGCSINVSDEHGFRHAFAVEPLVSAVIDSGPRQPTILKGDIIVSVDGFLITTVEGGRRLANLKAGTRVALLVRRNDRLIELDLTPTIGCGITSLSVRP